MFLNSKRGDKTFCSEQQQVFLEFNPVLIFAFTQFIFLSVVRKYLRLATFSRHLLVVTPMTRHKYRYRPYLVL
jgi:hypothetical protein